MLGDTRRSRQVAARKGPLFPDSVSDLGVYLVPHSDDSHYLIKPTAAGPWVQDFLLQACEVKSAYC